MSEGAKDGRRVLMTRAWDSNHSRSRHPLSGSSGDEPEVDGGLGLAGQTSG